MFAQYRPTLYELPVTRDRFSSAIVSGAAHVITALRQRKPDACLGQDRSDIAAAARWRWTFVHLPLHCAGELA